MLKRIYKSNYRISYLPLSLHENFLKCIGDFRMLKMPFTAVQIQEVNGLEIVKETVIRGDNFKVFLAAQLELLLDVLMKLEEYSDGYNYLENLNGIEAEMEILILLTKNAPEDVSQKQHVRFMSEIFKPIISMKIKKTARLLFADHHNKYIRIKGNQKSLIRLKPMPEDFRIGVFEYFHSKFEFDEEYEHFKNEVLYGTPSPFVEYKLINTDRKSFYTLFKILAKKGYVNGSKKDLAEWLHRAFRIKIGTEYQQLDAARTIYDQLKGKELTYKESTIKIDKNFVYPPIK